MCHLVHSNEKDDSFSSDLIFIRNYHLSEKFDATEDAILELKF